MDSECLALPLPVLSTLGGGGGRGKATEEAIRPTYFGCSLGWRGPSGAMSGSSTLAFSLPAAAAAMWTCPRKCLGLLGSSLDWRAVKPKDHTTLLPLLPLPLRPVPRTSPWPPAATQKGARSTRGLTEVEFICKPSVPGTAQLPSADDEARCCVPAKRRWKDATLGGVVWFLFGSFTTTARLPSSRSTLAFGTLDNHFALWLFRKYTRRWARNVSQEEALKLSVL
ncbi:hypothetical protein B0H14DRAFT_2641413 [Mycena olivaceomarginata]|nr:hypothetical protein B0H14DRAFT_2641413 [Mycena olivaceomarginata]